MKKFFKGLVYIYLYLIAKLILIIKRPYVILVLGGENKSLIKEKLIRSATKQKMWTYENPRPYNTWFGITLSVMDLPSAYGDAMGWIYIFFLSILKFFKSLFLFPKYLILEGGIDESDEAKRFISLLKPHVVIFSSISESFTDDIKSMNIVEEEFYRFVSFINEKSLKYEKLDTKGNIEDILSLIKNGEKYFCVVNNKYERLEHLGTKIIRKVSINF